MKKQIVLALSLTIPFFPSLHAAEIKKPKTTWTYVKNGAKILIGTWLTVSGIRSLIGLAYMDDELLAHRVRGQLEITRHQRHERYRTCGIAQEEFQNRDAQAEQEALYWAELVKNVSTVFSVLFSVGGTALLYSGVSGLVQDEEEFVR